MRSLVVDDEFAALTKLTELLSPLGPCDPATNAKQALELFVSALDAGAAYQLVALDISMPGCNGLTLLERLLAEEQKHDVKACRKIMVSAASSTENVVQAIRGGCDAFLVKPVRRVILMAKLAEFGLIPFYGGTSPAAAPAGHHLTGG